jgi:hypothetical protein
MNMLKDGEHIVSMTNFPRLGCVQSRQYYAWRWSPLVAPLFFAGARMRCRAISRTASTPSLCLSRTRQSTRTRDLGMHSSTVPKVSFPKVEVSQTSAVFLRSLACEPLESEGH